MRPHHSSYIRRFRQIAPDVLIAPCYEQIAHVVHEVHDVPMAACLDQCVHVVPMAACHGQSVHVAQIVPGPAPFVHFVLLTAIWSATDVKSDGLFVSLNSQTRDGDFWLALSNVIWIETGSVIVKMSDNLDDIL